MDRFLSAALMLGWLAFVFFLVLTAARRRDAIARETAGHCWHRDSVAVRLELTSDHVSDWCPGCGQTIYMAAWVFRGDGSQP